MLRKRRTNTATAGAKKREYPKKENERGEFRNEVRSDIKVKETAKVNKGGETEREGEETRKELAKRMKEKQVQARERERRS